MASLTDWGPSCLSATYEFGAISADGQWLEARSGQFADEWPERVGVLPADCLEEFVESHCQPRWDETGIVVDDNLVLYPAAWSPDSEFFLMLNKPINMVRRLPSDFWRFDVQTGAFSLVARIPNGTDMDELLLEYIWSPNGMKTLVSQGRCSECGLRQQRLYALSVADGRLEVMASPIGSIVGSIKVP